MFSASDFFGSTCSGKSSSHVYVWISDDNTLPVKINRRLLNNPALYPASLSCVQQITGNTSFMRNIKEIQRQRLNRITNVCDMCTHAESKTVNSVRNTSQVPECRQLTEFPLRREMLSHILVDDTHKVKAIYWMHQVWGIRNKDMLSRFREKSDHEMGCFGFIPLHMIYTCLAKFVHHTE